MTKRVLARFPKLLSEDLLNLEDRSRLPVKKSPDAEDKTSEQSILRIVAVFSNAPLVHRRREPSSLTADVLVPAATAAAHRKSKSGQR